MPPLTHPCRRGLRPLAPVFDGAPPPFSVGSAPWPPRLGAAQKRAPGLWAGGSWLVADGRGAQYSGIGGVAGAGVLSGISVIRVSVVRIIVAIEAAFSRAERVTLSGSMMPASTMLAYSPRAAS
jgi:hypothetical protein